MARTYDEQIDLIENNKTTTLQRPTLNRPKYKPAQRISIVDCKQTQSNEVDLNLEENNQIDLPIININVLGFQNKDEFLKEILKWSKGTRWEKRMENPYYRSGFQEVLGIVWDFFESKYFRTDKHAVEFERLVKSLCENLLNNLEDSLLRQIEFIQGKLASIELFKVYLQNKTI